MPAILSAHVIFGIPLWAVILAALAAFYVVMSVRAIGPTEVGLVMKRISFRKLANDSPIAFQGEAGYQADLLMPGRRWKPWLFYTVERDDGELHRRKGAAAPSGHACRHKAARLFDLFDQAKNGCGK